MLLKKSIQNIKTLFSKNLVIKGTLILTLTGFATRMIGFYNRIFLADLIGAKELGIYQLIFPLYMVTFSLTTFGNEIALTKLVSEYKSRQDMPSAKAFFRVCFCINLFLGLIISTIMYQNADWLCIHILNAPECSKCLQVICLGIPFMSMKGAIHGYFLGLEKSGIHGMSDFLEQTAKVLGLYLLSSYICIHQQYDASFAVLGIVIGELVSFFYSVIALLIHNKKNAVSASISSSKTPIHTQQIIRLFLKDSVPITTNRLAGTVLQSMESIMIPTVLLSYYKNSALSLATYGIFSGMAFPFIMFPSTITNSLSTMLLPAVSSANSRLDQHYLKKLCEKSLHFCLLIGLFSMVAFYIYGPSIGSCFFNSTEAGYYLYQLSLLCPFIYLATTLASILNGLGFAAHNLLLTIIATIIRISFILFAVPQIGISGYITGLFFSYLFLTFACLHKLQKMIPFELQFTQSIFFPIVTFVLLGVLSFYGYQKFILLFSNSIPVIVLLIITICIYGIISLLPFLRNCYHKS